MDQPKESRTTFGKALKADREARKMTQQQVADAIGVKQQHVAGWEAGKNLPRPDSWEKLVDFFGQGSTIAFLPQRGEIVVPPPESTVMFTRQSEGLEFHPTKVAMLGLEPPASEQPTTKRDLVSTFVDSLPERLRENVARPIDVHGVQYKPDYMSHKLCAEIKRIKGKAFILSAARAGMQQLMYMRELNKREPADGREYGLFLLIDSWEVLTDARTRRLDTEASALGLKLMFVNTVDAIGRMIAGYESGEVNLFNAPEEALEDDY